MLLVTPNLGRNQVRCCCYDRITGMEESAHVLRIKTELLETVVEVNNGRSDNRVVL